MEFWEWCRELRHAYRSSGVVTKPVRGDDETRIPGQRKSVPDPSTGGEKNHHSCEGSAHSLVLQGTVQGSKRPVTCLLETKDGQQQYEESPLPKLKEDISDVTTRTVVVCGSDSTKGQQETTHSEDDCMFTTAMSGPSPFDMPGDDSFPITHVYEKCETTMEDIDANDSPLEGSLGEVITSGSQDPNLVQKKSSIYSKSKTFPTTRQNHHTNLQRPEKQTCPPHGAKSVMGRRAKMEDTFVAIPDLIGVAFADSLNEIIPPRIADQIQQNNGQSVVVSDTEEGGVAHGDSMPMPKQNHRNTAPCTKGLQEDKTIEQIHFFGVFDGHGGADAAHHCKETMHERLKEAIMSTYFEEGNGQMEDLNPSSLCSSEAFSRALAEAFRVTDEDFAKMGGGTEELSLVGTTAVVALLSSQSMYLANAGDSRAVLYRDGKALALTDDHKAAREDETARVEAAGGQILFWNGVRVMGLLAVSRAIGDHSLRPYVIADPEVTVVNRHASDELLVMASDGLWDVISNQEACALAKKCLLRARQRGSSRENAARVAATVLTRAAVDRGSRDNVTVLVIDLMQDPDEFLHADAMKMRLSEEIVAAREMSSSDDAAEPATQEENGDAQYHCCMQSHEDRRAAVNSNNAQCDESNTQHYDTDLAPNHSFKSPFELVEPPPNLAE